MRYLSVCSGIEAASVAWHHLGWTPVAFSEIEPFPAAVLAHHYPNIPNYGDMTKHKEWPLEPGAIDLLVGGTPCQSFSVAGLRKGLTDPRGNLMLTYLAIAAQLRPRWIVWENVPGVLSSNGGRDFGTFLGALGELGYGWAYRVLDAQYVRVGRWPRAVPQRRRRVFVVGRLLERGAGDWTAAAQAVLIPEGMRRHIEASPKARKVAPPDAEGGARGGGIFTSHGVAPCLETTSNDYSRADGFTMVAQPTAYRWQNNELGLRQDDAVAALRASAGSSGFHEMNHPVIAQPNAAHAAVAFHPLQDPISSTDGSTHCMGTGGSQGHASIAVATTMTVRRLSAEECEALQGFSRGWTRIPWRKKPAHECPDGPRYKALGNSMAVNCMAWIGERIHAYEQTGRVAPAAAEAELMERGGSGTNEGGA